MCGLSYTATLSDHDCLFLFVYARLIMFSQPKQWISREGMPSSKDIMNHVLSSHKSWHKGWLRWVPNTSSHFLLQFT